MSSGLVKKFLLDWGDLSISDFQTFMLRHADGAQPPEESKGMDPAKEINLQTPLKPHV